MDYSDLTDRQKKVLNIIVENVQTNGLPPTLREIRDRSDIDSLRGVTLQLDILEKDGFLSRRKGARGIKLNSFLLDSKEETISIRLITSTIPAGVPTLAEEHSDERIDVSLLQTKGVRDVFAVKVSGDSMVDAGIDDGDIALITPQTIVNDGDIVSAVIEGGVFLKRFRLVEGIPMLLPANPKYQPILDKFEIQGKLVNVIKKS